MTQARNKGNSAKVGGAGREEGWREEKESLGGGGGKMNTQGKEKFRRKGK